MVKVQVVPRCFQSRLTSRNAGTITPSIIFIFCIQGFRPEDTMSFWLQLEELQIHKRRNWLLMKGTWKMRIFCRPTVWGMPLGHCSLFGIPGHIKLTWVYMVNIWLSWRSWMIHFSAEFITRMSPCAYCVLPDKDTIYNQWCRFQKQG
jgi:hypothetical protein